MGVSNFAVGANYFRLIYETVETAPLIQGHRIPAGQSGTSYLVTKIAIATLDAFSRACQWMELAPNLRMALNLGEFTVRVVDIYRGFDLIRTNPQADKRDLQFGILLNLLNIQRLACDILRLSGIAPSKTSMLQTASLVCVSLDTAFRAISIFYHRFAIGFHLIQMVQHLDFDRIGRTIAQTMCSVKSAAIGATILFYVRKAMGAQGFNQAIAVGGVSLLTGKPIIRIVDNIFNSLGILHHPMRDTIVQAISFIGAISLGVACTVGFGLASSASELYRNILLVVLSWSLAIALHEIGKMVADELLDLLGIQNHNHRDCVRDLAGLFGPGLVPTIAVGYGFAQSSGQVGNVFLFSGAISLGSIFFYMAFDHMRSLKANGPMSWGELGKTFITI